jgi:hypothetical protein
VYFVLCKKDASSRNQRKEYETSMMTNEKKSFFFSRYDYVGTWIKLNLRLETKFVIRRAVRSWKTEKIDKFLNF